MTHPFGAVKSLEEMQALIGQEIYFNVHKNYSSQPLLTGRILKLTPLSIKRHGLSYIIHTREHVYGYSPCEILTGITFKVDWGSYPRYYFAKYWYALAHALREQAKEP